MKKLFFAVLAIASVTLILWAAEPITQTRPLKIDNTRDEVKLTIQGPATHTSNVVEFLSGSNLKFAVPNSGHLPLAYGGTGTNTAAGVKNLLGIQAGSATTAADGTVTNTFAVAFSAAPKVTITPVACNSPTNTIATPTTTNVVITIGEAAIVVHWIAVGAP